MKNLHSIYALAIFTVSSFLFSINSYAQDGSLDLSFGIGGKVTTAISGGDDDNGKSVAIQSDGKIVVAGTTINDGDRDFAIVRYNNDGTLDLSFGTDGKVVTDFGSNWDECYSVAIQSDGKIVAAGNIANGSTLDFAISRYNSDGTLDLSFDNDGMLTTDFAGKSDIITSIALQGDGKIVATGITTSATAFNCDFAVVRYNIDGSLDLNFGTAGKVITQIGTDNDTPRSLAIQNDGKIVVAGYSVFSGDMYFALVRYNSDGTLDLSFDNDGKVTTSFGNEGDYGLSVAIQPDGKIVVSGKSYNNNIDIAVTRYNIDGSLDTSFDNDGMLTIVDENTNEEGLSVAIQSNGKILLAGYSNDDFVVVRLNSDGSLDPSFGTNGKVITPIGNNVDAGYSLAIQSDGKIVVAGLSFNNTNNDFAVVRYNNDISGIFNVNNEHLIIDLYPNPSNGATTATLSSSLQKDLHINIFNMQGEQVFSAIHQNKNTVEIDLSSFAKSIYMIKIQTESGCITKKLVIQ